MGYDRTLHLRYEHSHVFGKCCARLVKLHDSTYGVVFAMPGNVIRSPPCSERGGTEVSSSTTYLLHSPAFPTHWQNGLRTRRRQDHQFLEALLPRGILISASTPLPSRTSVVMARLTTSCKAKSLAMRASWDMKGSPWLFRKMSPSPRQPSVKRQLPVRWDCTNSGS